MHWEERKIEEVYDDWSKPEDKSENGYDHTFSHPVLWFVHYDCPEDYGKDPA